MTIKIEMLRCFCTVAETGSLAEASMRLGRTPSAISMTLKQLEEHFGQRLFESDRKNRLTQLGSYVLELAQTELQQFDNTVAAMDAYARNPGGLLRIAAVPSVAARIFVPAVDRLRARFPGLSVELRDMESGAVLHALSRGLIEIGLATSAGAMRNIGQEPLFSDPFGLICDRAHPLATAPDDPALADLEEHGFLGNALCATVDDPRLQAMVDGAVLQAQNTYSLIAMIRSGNRVTVLPSSVALIDPGALVFRPIRDLQAQRRVDLLYRSDKDMADYVSAFRDALQGLSL